MSRSEGNHDGRFQEEYQAAFNSWAGAFWIALFGSGDFAHCRTGGGRSAFYRAIASHNAGKTGNPAGDKTSDTGNNFNTDSTKK
jgi:hypothetical protein